MILEGLVTTTDAAGLMHLAPMGPIVGEGFRTLLLRPYPDSSTYKNLVAHEEGVFHVTDDAALIARAALGKLTKVPSFDAAEKINGFVLDNCCRAYEFRVCSIDTSGERVRIETDVIQQHTLRHFIGFNRARHAIIEAAIMLTRLHILPRGEVETEFRKFRVVVDKTGGEAELDAMEFLEKELAEAPR